MIYDSCGQLLPGDGWYAVFIEVDEQGRGNAIQERLIAWVEVIRTVKSTIGTDTKVKELTGIYNNMEKGPTLIIDDPWFVCYKHDSKAVHIGVDFINKWIKKVRGEVK